MPNMNTLSLRIKNMANVKKISKVGQRSQSRYLTLTVTFDLLLKTSCHISRTLFNISFGGNLCNRAKWGGGASTLSVSSHPIFLVTVKEQLITINLLTRY